MNTIKQLIEELQDWWDEISMDFSEDRYELAHARLVAHRESMNRRYPSPYTSPEKYDSRWEPVIKLSQRP